MEHAVGRAHHGVKAEHHHAGVRLVQAPQHLGPGHAGDVLRPRLHEVRDHGLRAVAVEHQDLGRPRVAQPADHGGHVAHEVLPRLPVQRGFRLAGLGELVDAADALQIGLDVDLQLGRGRV